LGQNYGELANVRGNRVTRPAVESDRPVTLVGPARVRKKDFDLAISRGEAVVAADGGAQNAMDLGRLPDLVIGDFDSFEPAGRLPAERLLRIDDQDTTDFEKCLERISAPLVIAVGFLGRRIDHSLAVLSALAAHEPGRCLLVGGHDVVVHCPARLALDLPPASRVSLFPMVPLTARSEGLEWPVGGIDFAPAGRIGTSNRVTGAVVIEPAGPGMLLILPRKAFRPLLRGLGHG